MLLLLLACAPTDTATLTLHPPPAGASSERGVPPPPGTVTESVLSRFELALTRIELGRASGTGMEWIELHNNPDDEWAVDLVTGAGSELVLAVPIGEWDHLLLSGPGYQWQRAASECGPEENTNPLAGVVTTVANSFDRGQVFDPILGVTEAPDTLPSDLHPDATDGLFWTLSAPLEIEAGVPVDAWLSAPPLGPMVEAQPCQESPGKPVFSVDVAGMPVEDAHLSVCLVSGVSPFYITFHAHTWAGDGSFGAFSREEYCASLGGAYHSGSAYSDVMTPWSAWVRDHGYEVPAVLSLVGTCSLVFSGSGESRAIANYPSLPSDTHPSWDAETAAASCEALSDNGTPSAAPNF